MSRRTRRAPTMQHRPPPEARAPSRGAGSHGNAALAEQVPRVAAGRQGTGPARFIEPEWSRDLGHEETVDPAVAAAARELNLCSQAQTDASCLEDLGETAQGRQLLTAGDAVRRETAVHTRDTSHLPAPAPYRERVGGNDLQHLDVGDGGIHAHILDMSARGDGVEVNGPQVALHVGQINERESYDEGRQYGIRGETSLASVALGDEDLGVDLNTPHAEFEASAGSRGLVLEAGGSILDADGRSRFEDLGDTRAEYGLGAEGRFGIRLPMEDTDDDGVTERGIGISAGIARFQVTTEAIDQAGSWISDHLTGGDR